MAVNWPPQMHEQIGIGRSRRRPASGAFNRIEHLRMRVPQLSEIANLSATAKMCHTSIEQMIGTEKGGTTELRCLHNELVKGVRIDQLDLKSLEILEAVLEHFITPGEGRFLLTEHGWCNLHAECLVISTLEHERLTDSVAA